MADYPAKPNTISIWRRRIAKEDKMAEQQTDTMGKIVSLCKRRGFIFQSSEIYGGLASTWDYGPLGAELKRNLKDAWWRSTVYERDDIEGLDASILMHPMTWMASGHVTSFEDTLADCKGCKKRFKVEHLVKNKCPAGFRACKSSCNPRS